MPPVGDAQMHAPPDAAPAADAGAALSASFRFIPRELATKCRRLIESYHAITAMWVADVRGCLTRAP